MRFSEDPAADGGVRYDAIPRDPATGGVTSGGERLRDTTGVGLACEGAVGCEDRFDAGADFLLRVVGGVGMPA